MQLILDIFAMRARSHEGSCRTPARSNTLPRLGQESSLNRQAGELILVDQGKSVGVEPPERS